jgi:hypothetical protein
MTELTRNEPQIIRNTQIIMDRVQKFTQAYSQTPWRRQVGFIGMFLAGLVIFAFIAGIYLHVSNRAILVGRQIHSDYASILRIEREIEDLRTDLAELTSTTSMEIRAQELGFRPARSDEILYIEVPEYDGRQEIAMAPTMRAFEPSQPDLSPEFTQSLFDWVQTQLTKPPVSIESLIP